MTAQDWYLVQTKPKSESVALAHLERQGYEVYLPMDKVMLRNATGYSERVVPMFSRYLFVRLSELMQSWYSIKSTRGVSRLVRFGETPARISRDVVALLRAKESGVLLKSAVHPIQVGDAVEVFKGAFMGFRGVVESCDAHERVTLLLQYAQSYTRLTLARNDVAHA